MNKKEQLVLALTLAITGKDNCPKTKHCEEIAEALCVGMPRSEIEACKALAIINADKTLEEVDWDEYGHPVLLYGTPEPE